MREKLTFAAEVRAWQEDQSPTKIAAAALADRGIRTGRIGVEETASFTFYDHLRSAAPGLECVSADPVTIACRGRKSAHELELMRLACEATFDVFRAVFASVKEGMSQEDIGKLVESRSEEHTSELQSHSDLVCRLLLEKKKKRSPLSNS